MPRVALKCVRLVDSPISFHRTTIPLKPKMPFGAPGPVELGEPDVFFISEEIRRIQGIHKFYKLRPILDKWDIPRISPAHARIWIEEDGGRVLPAALRWDELGKLARALEMETCDATRIIMAIKDRKLQPTGRLKDPCQLTNAEIRGMIADYFNGRSDKAPPTLYAELFLDYFNRPSIYFTKASDGSQVFIPIEHVTTFLPFSLAGVTAISREEIQVTLLTRTLNQLKNRSDHIQWVTWFKRPPKIIPPKAPEPEERSSSAIDLRGRRIAEIAQALKGWFYDEDDCRPMLFGRRITSSQMTLGTIDNTHYKLPGYGKIPREMKEGLLLLQKEGEKSPKMRTASLFPMDSDPLNEPEKKLVTWRLPLGEPYSGAVIFPDLKKTV